MCLKSCLCVSCLGLIGVCCKCILRTLTGKVYDESWVECKQLMGNNPRAYVYFGIRSVRVPHYVLIRYQYNSQLVTKYVLGRIEYVYTRTPFRDSMVNRIHTNTKNAISMCGTHTHHRYVYNTTKIKRVLYCGVIKPFLGILGAILIQNKKYKL